MSITLRRNAANAMRQRRRANGVGNANANAAAANERQCNKWQCQMAANDSKCGNANATAAVQMAANKCKCCNANAKQMAATMQMMLALPAMTAAAATAKCNAANAAMQCN